MQPDLVAAILDAVRATWSVANDWEVTLEANPGSVEAGRFSAYRQAGVNRISMGIQSLDDDALRKLGRLHTADDARVAFAIARGLFDRVSFDLIYARQHQSLQDWEAELRHALSLAIDHISLYQLTIEDGTVFAERFRRGGLKGLPGEDLAADMFSLTREICADMGFPAYEVSNHARSGAESQHNLIYWRGDDYGGIGPGAHGRLPLPLGRHATVGHAQPGAWLQAVETTGSGQETPVLMSEAEIAAERIMMGLRLTSGILRQHAGVFVSEATINTLLCDGLIWSSPDQIGATDRGVLVLNHVIRTLLNA